MSRRKLAILALILASIIWGAGVPIFKWSLVSMPPLLLAFFRFAIPLLLMIPFLGKLQKIRTKDLPFVIVLGIFNCLFNIGLYFIGLQFAPSINQSIIACSGPIFIIIGSSIFLKDRATKKILLGNIIGLTGVLFIVFEPVKGIYSPLALLGNSLFVVSTLCASIGTVIARKLAQRYNAITLLFWTFLVSTLGLSPIFLQALTTHTLFADITFHSLAGILYGGIFSSFLAYMLFYWGLESIKASEQSIFTYIDPVATVLIAAPLLHEYPNFFFLLGSFLVFFGIFVAEGRIHYHPLHLLFKR